MATITKRGERQWQAKVRRRRITATQTFETKGRANAWARQVESDIDAGRFQHGRVEADKTTLHEALDRYLMECVPKKAGVKQNAGIVRAWQAWTFSRRSLTAIRAVDLAQWRDDMAQHVGAQTIVHHLNLLSHLYNVAACDWGMESLINPVARLKRPPLPKGRDRRLTSEDENMLLVACQRSASTWLRPIVELAIATAMRQGEMVGLTWTDVDLANRTVRLSKTKNGETRTVPLSSRAIAVLGALLPSSGGKVFPVQTGRAVTHAFSKAAAGAGLADLRFHDLRHEATSRLFERTDLRDIEIASITGHQTMDMLKRYSHLRAGDLASRLG